MKKLLSVDAQKGKQTIAHHDGEGGLILETKQDISKIIEVNKQKFNDVTSLDRWGDMTHIATIPDAVIDDLNKIHKSQDHIRCKCTKCGRVQENKNIYDYYAQKQCFCQSKSTKKPLD